MTHPGKLSVILLVAVLALVGGVQLRAQQNRYHGQPAPDRTTFNPMEKLGELRDSLNEKLQHSARQGRVDMQSDQRLRRQSDTLPYNRQSQFADLTPEQLQQLQNQAQRIETDDRIFPAQAGIGHNHSRAGGNPVKSETEFIDNRQFNRRSDAAVRQVRYQEPAQTNQLRPGQSHAHASSGDQFDYPRSVTGYRMSDP